MGGGSVCCKGPEEPIPRVQQTHAEVGSTRNKEKHAKYPAVGSQTPIAHIASTDLHARVNSLFKLIEGKQRQRQLVMALRDHMRHTAASDDNMQRYYACKRAVHVEPALETRYGVPGRGLLGQSNHMPLDVHAQSSTT